MEEIVKAIEKLAEKDIIDYLLIIVPIVISLLAVAISVVTARKQNKIAMFELRYKALSAIKRISNFATVFYITDQTRIVIEMFNSCFSTSLNCEDKTMGLVAAKNELNNLEESVAAVSDILNDSDKKILEKTFAMLSKIINSTIMDDIEKQDVEDFKLLCVFLEEITAKKLSKKILGSSWCFDYCKVYEDTDYTDSPISSADIARVKRQISDIVKKEKKKK